MMLLGAVVIVILGLVASTYWMSKSKNHRLLPAPATPLAAVPAPVAPLVAPPIVQPVAAAAPSLPPASVSGENSAMAVSQVPRPLVASDKAISILKIDAALSSAQEQNIATLPDKLKFSAVAKSPAGTIEKHRSDGVQEVGYENYRKAISAYNQGHLSAAVELLLASLHESPRQVAARQTLLGIYVEQKQWEEAESLLKEGLVLMPEQLAWAMALARIQVERGYTADAWATLQKYQAYAEQNADFHGFAGILLQQLQKPHEAAAQYRTALQLRPGEGRWWYGLGITLEADNLSGEAREAFQRARNVGGITPEMRTVIDKKLN
jgi:MSHA biogenesis protein MshN